MSIQEDYSALQQVMNDYSEWVRSSALKILPWVDIEKKSIVDFGCGRGDWLRVAKELAASRILGLDTFALEKFQSDIPIEYVNLTEPVQLPDRWDIAMCLEVGEHLPENVAATLVQSLVNAAPVVLFSAAAPGQGGVHHINEQPPEFWFDLFKMHGYQCFDFRDEIWADEEIEPWYRMGVLVFADPSHTPSQLKNYRREMARHIIHPDIFAAYAPKGRNLILHYDKKIKQWYPQFLEDSEK
ncbi:methyltransferase domain-containing protein [Rhodovarius sp.]|uniref:methyltransferase domain-containing protein n=1 Tax=Rhodovarius sp. TaxID=2972673 RepID=UPI0034A4D783